MLNKTQPPLAQRVLIVARARSFRVSAPLNAQHAPRPQVAARRCHRASAIVVAKSHLLHAAKAGRRKTDAAWLAPAASAAAAMNSHRAVATVTARHQAVKVLVRHVVVQRAAALVMVPRHVAAALAVAADTVEIPVAAMAARAAGRAPVDVVVMAEIPAVATVVRAAADMAVTAGPVQAVEAIVAAQAAVQVRTHRVHAGAIVVIPPAVQVARLDPAAVATAAEPVPADAAATVAARVAVADLAAVAVAATAAAIVRAAAQVDMVVALTAKPRAAADRVAGEAVMRRLASHVASRAADAQAAVAQAVAAQLRALVVVWANVPKEQTHARAPTQLRMLQQRLATRGHGRAHLHV